MGFKRRDAALSEFGVLLGNVRAVWGAVQAWTVKTVDGRWVRVLDNYGDPQQARRDLHQLHAELLLALIAYFDVERWGRSRQTMACCGAEEQIALMGIAHGRRLRVDSGISRLQRLVQDLKAHGLPGGEAHRLDSYVSKVGVAFERLTHLKEYRHLHWDSNRCVACGRSTVLCIPVRTERLKLSAPLLAHTPFVSGRSTDRTTFTWAAVPLKRRPTSASPWLSHSQCKWSCRA